MPPNSKSLATFNNNDHVDSRTWNKEDHKNNDVLAGCTKTKKQRGKKKGGRSEAEADYHMINQIQDYIPLYLRSFVKPYYGDFCFSPYYHPVLVGQLLSEGFLTIASSECLLPKLHENRCVIDLTIGGETNSSKVHISKSSKKKSGRFELTINQSFNEVVAGCHAQHGSSCWLYPPLVCAFRTIHEHSKGSDNNASLPLPSFPAKVFDSDQVSPPRICNLRLYSIEIWNKDTQKLAGGELGYTVGSIYTSLTGFSCEDSAGSVQLAALGSLLVHNNFTLWDLGMDMEYKRKLGAILMSRKDFVDTVHSVREEYGHLTVKLTEGNRMNCKNLISVNLNSVSERDSAKKVKLEP